MAAVSAVGTVAKFAGAHRAANKENKARIKAYNIKKKNYLNNFNREVVAWQSDVIDNEIKIDSLDLDYKNIRLQNGVFNISNKTSESKSYKKPVVLCSIISL